MKMNSAKPQWIVWSVVLLVLLALTSPFWLWQIFPSKQLDVLIVDKTVPDQTYREHKGLVWVLNNEKYKKEDNTAYSLENDYIGFKPGEDKTSKVDRLPNNLSNYDVLYLTDQYGVYEEEFYGENEEGKRSASLYGGLEASEVKTLRKELLKGGKTLISEFNTFASPTPEPVRASMSNLLNLDWSGWIGRYFTDLNGKEVPVWIKEQYKSQNGKWDVKGAGFVLVNQDDYILVLSGSELRGEGLRFQLTEAGQDDLDLDIDSEYQYWFDIVEARNTDEILASYELPVTAEAEKKLEGNGIPSEFPAIIHHQNTKYASYYFSGDFADEAEVPGIYQTRGLTAWKQHVTSKDSFYWNTYVPLMKKVLANGLYKEHKNVQPELAEADGVTYNSTTKGSHLQIQKDGKWEDLTLKGVNMGIAKPGHFPGETAISKDEYLRWFKAIGDMNANSIRVYTLHPPEFYEAFYEYNQLAEKPLYLFHGAWVNEEMLVKSQDSFSKEVNADFERELTQMVDIIHGNAELPESAGHASGTYKADISPYVLGFIIGIEWDPNAALETNKKHDGMPQFNGIYFKTENAQPFEIWLAEKMEFTAAYEAEQYGWQHSMSFTNWVTTDLLAHPAEPSEEEDMVSVNPNKIAKTDQFKAGMFASYHIYPYYPDFMHLEEKYTNYKDWEGKNNHYAGYLNDLIKVHNMPVLVAEFGVPASRGQTHRNNSGMNQGFLTEREQGEINTRLFQSILSEGYAGGIVFTWQDEWFKRTWNTMDFDNPERRPFWSNKQTNEQNFGVLGFEPGKKGSQLFVDGNSEDWAKKGAEPAYQAKEGIVKQSFITSDEAYVYFRIDYRQPVDWESQNTYLLLDTIEGQGQKSILLEKDVLLSADHGIDFKVELTGPDSSRILVDSYYDGFYYQYGEQLKMIPKKDYANNQGSGIFHPMRLALNKEMTLPSSGKKLPFQAYETGRLRFGTANADDKDFDSLTDISISKDKKTVEGRIPWQLLNVKDPSTKEILGDVWKGGLEKSKQATGITVSLAVTEHGKLTTTLPKMDGGEVKMEDAYLYKWKEWEEPLFHERLKQSYYLLKDTFEEQEGNRP
ncbi:hypothetical protein [Mesobacillus foraminis]|uniref:hypothetical protein n=1 Tax=Mesobacillus foraminis TaxID=279826 RepID=UPI00203641E9|nr:hypothetical protein [Mesobacillus foraminis]